MATVYPRPPQGLSLKLARARKHLRHLRRIFERFQASNPWTLRRQINADGTHYLYSFEIVQPRDITQVLADEAIHHLRTVLDHLVVAVVESVGNTATNDHAFPIWRTEPKTSEDIARYDAMLKHVPDEARTLIDSLQPYTRGANANSHPLAILARLDNRFKHTSLHLLSHQVLAPAVSGIIQPPAPAHGRDAGDVFAAVPTSFDVQKDFEPYVSIEIAFRIRAIGLPEINLDRLDEIYNYVRDEVIRKLVRGRGLPRRL